MVRKRTIRLGRNRLNLLLAEQGYKLENNSDKIVMVKIDDNGGDDE